MATEKISATDEFDRQLAEFVAGRQDSPDEIEQIKGFIYHLRRAGFNLTKAGSPQPFAQGKPA